MQEQQKFTSFVQQLLQRKTQNDESESGSSEQFQGKRSEPIFEINSKNILCSTEFYR